MMKFKLSLRAYLFIIIIFICIAISYVYDKHTLFAYIVYSIFFIGLIYSFINVSYYFILVDEKGILSKTLVKRKLISWDEVSEFRFNANKGVLAKYSVTVRGNFKEINISNWTKNSKELIKIIIDECKKRDKKVDILVEKIIEE
ncbi:MAG: hypothetical protein PHX70_06485 [Clostridium sp.]|nr:hypothetical protein [Clostridium sp.]